jgi:hypothetical protein
MRFLRLNLPLLALGLAWSGCTSLAPPKQMPPTTACLEDYQPINQDRSPPRNADVVLIAQFYTRSVFASQTTNSRRYEWHLEMFAVLQVEQGYWTNPGLTFVCVDASNRLDNGPSVAWPYHMGVIMRFWLDTHHSPPLIVGQQTLQG